ncbi:MAG: PQQ-dependent sugar dehydrogenase [Mesorhizobium sp.]|nr:PQQ-dependent sugar dehydrogenase [Mesorhizobium sp.]
MPISLSRIRGDFALTASAAVLALAIAAPGAHAQDESAYDVETVAEGFDNAWGMAFLPDDGRLLVSERPGRIKLVDRESGEVQEISGLPDIHAEGQGGLLDIAIHPDFAEENWLYMAWSGTNDEGQSSTYVGRARLDVEALELSDLEELFVAEPFDAPGAGHYGSRLAFDADNRLYFSVGDRQSKEFGPEHVAQDLSVDLGKIHRIEADGSVPDDNPFVDIDNARETIWSYGHRNPQGLGFHPDTGELWENEHGENNGDEINIIQGGENFGWPIATWGVDYQTGERFAPTPPEVADTVEPVYWWEPDHPEGFPPSGLTFYDGDAFPDWQGHIFMGNLRHQFLGRFSVDGTEVEMEERLLDGEGWRIRDVAVGPDNGYLYVLIDDANAPLVRLVPASD